MVTLQRCSYRRKRTYGAHGRNIRVVCAIRAAGVFAPALFPRKIMVLPWLNGAPAGF